MFSILDQFGQFDALLMEEKGLDVLSLADQLVKPFT